MADDLLRRRLPWLMENGRHKPVREWLEPIVVDQPVLLHERSHR